MYQVKYQCGNEIQVIGRGANGLARVVTNSGEIRFSGGYDDCVKWLSDRGVSESKGDGYRKTAKSDRDNR